MMFFAVEKFAKLENTMFTVDNIRLCIAIENGDDGDDAIVMINKTQVKVSLNFVNNQELVSIPTALKPPSLPFSG